MNYCSACGFEVAYRIPEGDDKERYVCKQCDTIHYSNPRMVVGSLPEVEGKLLICKRAIEPEYGKWTLPAGYLENGESVSDCAIRETREEAGTEIVDLTPLSALEYPLSQFNLLHVSGSIEGPLVSSRPGEP